MKITPINPLSARVFIPGTPLFSQPVHLTGFILALLLLSLALPADLLAGTYSGGSGTESNPYEIATTDDLIELSNTSGDWGAYFIQTADITFDADEQNVDWDGDNSADWDDEDQKGFSPIGNNTTKFTGSYNGDGFTIDNLFINRPSTDHVGLFGYAHGAEISNLELTNVDITGNQYVGGLVGYNENGGTVNNSTSSGSVNGDVNVGGLVGYNNEGTVSNSTSSGSVQGSGNVVGGLMGWNSGGTVNNSYSTGSVNCTGDNTGGLVGNNFGTVNNSYSTGSVNCTGDNVGGLVGNNFGTVSDSFWDTDTSGVAAGVGNEDPDPEGVTGKTTAEMKDQSTFSGWTFDADHWAISDGNSRPYLAWQDVAVDNGYPTVGSTSVEFPAGNIRNNSGESLDLTYGYMYRQDDPPAWDNCTKHELASGTAVADESNQEITAATIDSLDQSTTYYARAYATDGTTVWYGDTVRFETGDAPTEYTLTVNKGTGDGDYQEGDDVDIEADSPPSGKEFDTWTGDTDGVTDVTNSSTTVTMPAQDVEVTATYTPSMAGAGTEADPYQIQTWYDLNVVRDNLDKHFELQNDLDTNTDGYAELVSPDAVTQATQFFGSWSGVESGTELELQAAPVDEILSVIDTLGNSELSYSRDLENGTITLE